MLVIGDDGNPRHGKPTDSLWWINYVLFPHKLTRRMHMKFRRRFRMPLETCKALVDKMNDHELFRMWHRGAINRAKKLHRRR